MSEFSASLFGFTTVFQKKSFRIIGLENANYLRLEEEASAYPSSYSAEKMQQNMQRWKNTKLVWRLVWRWSDVAPPPAIIYRAAFEELFTLIVRLLR